MNTLIAILLALSIAVISFDIWVVKQIKKEKWGMLLCIPPFLVNLITSQFAIYFAAMIWASYQVGGTVNFNSFMMILFPVLIQTIANQLMYFLYYKKKKVLTGKQYFLISLAGVLSIILYATYMECRLYLTIFGIL